MSLTRTVTALLLGTAILASGTMTAMAQSSGAEALASIDSDHDGSLSTKEIAKAARAHFRALDPDADGTLDLKEAGKIGITKSELSRSDLDKDGTIDEKEFIAIVLRRFHKVNKDSDKTIDAAELDTPAGQALLQLIK